MLFLLLASLASAQQTAAPPAPAAIPEVAKTEHLEVQLAPQTTAAIPGSTLYVALRHKITPGWHTYWRNSGDAGLPTKAAWTLPEGWKAGEIEWPTPRVVKDRRGMVTGNGYEGDTLLPVTITPPATARA